MPSEVAVTEPAVQVDDLRIRSAAGTILDGTALAVDRGERVGLVGESGSGKSTLSLALLGSVAPGLELAAGNVTVLGGVTIGNGCVIGANSLVTKDIPAGYLALGSPAQPVRKITEKDRVGLKELFGL